MKKIVHEVHNVTVKLELNQNHKNQKISQQTEVTRKITQNNQLVAYW